MPHTHWKESFLNVYAYQVRKFVPIMSLVFTIYNYILVVFATPLAQAICSLPKNVGEVCDDNPKELRWYFNESKFKCMAFTFLGCSGNGNNFVSLKECQRSCLPSDGPACQSGTFASPLIEHDSSQCAKTGCPEGYVCRRGPFFSQCCNKTAEAWFSESYTNKCKNGKRAFSVGDDVLNADSCDGFECPDDLLCESTNPLFAKCCSND